MGQSADLSNMMYGLGHGPECRSLKLMDGLGHGPECRSLKHDVWTWPWARVQISQTDGWTWPWARAQISQTDGWIFPVQIYVELFKPVVLQHHGDFPFGLYHMGYPMGRNALLLDFHCLKFCGIV